MKESRETFDLIEKYLEGTLSKQEHSQVEERIANDPLFAEEVQNIELLNSVVIGASLDSLRERMTQDMAKMDAKQKIRNNYKRLAGGGIALFGLISASYLYLNDSNKAGELKPVNNDTKEQIIKSNTNNIKEETTIMSSTENATSVGSKVVEEKHTPSIVSEILPDNFPIENKISQNDLLIDKKGHDEVSETNNQMLVEDKSAIISTNCDLSFKPIVQASCEGERTGSISVNLGNIKEGSAPYKISIDRTVTESAPGIFTDLAEGEYIVTIKDKAGCTASKEVTVPGKRCQQNTFSINPDNGEIWKLPYIEGESGKISIINKAGMLIFKGAFGDGGVSEWNGRDMNGAELSAGMYVYILEYSNGKTENGQITIVR